MSVFAISDLHLSFAKPKPMDVFDPRWENHAAQIEKNWRQTVGAEDLVLIPGDISWAMDLNEAAPDLEFLQALPGKKLLMSGNHDYWWSSLSRLQSLYPHLHFLRNNCFCHEGLYICGTRGWQYPLQEGYTAQDEKIFNREVGRLRLSLNSALCAGAKEIAVMLHFPPCDEAGTPNEMTKLIAAVPQIKAVLYGHLHGQREESCTPLPLQTENFLVSADYIGFTPKKIFG